MPIIFRDVHVPRQDGSLRHAPFIPILLTNKFDRVMQVVALLDSGADTTVVPKDLSELLGLKEEGVDSETAGIGGAVKVKKSRLRFKIKGNRSII